ncbi:MAG TPA: hypothetical protein VN618_04610 [Solirubrobacteraceae bacterium]|nr:hypothetical protein [Solirubrobacteraceae bacterium]
MRNRHRRSSPIESLRLAIDCLPVVTRRAMLDAVTSAERVIVGAYTDGSGGVCPMLAAHRRGGRTDFISFAKSWDRFARSRGGSRPATDRELRILVTQLEASLHESDGLELDRAIAEHRTLIAERIRRGPRRADDAHDPAGEIRARRLRRGLRRRRSERDSGRPTAPAERVLQPA